MRPEPATLDAARLNALALGYVARFATSAGKLETYLLRKLKAPPGAGWQQPDDESPDLRGEVTALVARFVAAGYVDDQAFAQARSGGLQRRGYGRRHIAQALGQAGIAAEVVATALPDEQAARQAALALARKRRLGPFGPTPQDRPAREKQIATLLRAGHPLDSARKLVNATSMEAAEAWASADEESE
jgi:regulatory protein